MRMRRCRRHSLCEFIPTKRMCCDHDVSIVYVSCVIKLVDDDDINLLIQGYTFASYVLAYTDSIPITQYLVTICDPNKYMGLALNLAVDHCCSEKVQVLIKAGANPDLVHSNFIGPIIYNRRMSILCTLLDSNINITKKMCMLEFMCRYYEVLKEYLGMRTISTEIHAHLLDYTRQFNMYDSMKLLQTCNCV